VSVYRPAADAPHLQPRRGAAMTGRNCEHRVDGSGNTHIHPDSIVRMFPNAPVRCLLSNDASIMKRI
jgi:hypothetical protein